MKNNVVTIFSVFSCMMTSSIAFASVPLQGDSHCLGQREDPHALELIRKVRKKIFDLDITDAPQVEQRQLRNQQGEVILTLPQQYIVNCWEIPLKSGLQKFAGTELELLVPYVLQRMVFLPTPTEVFRRKIESRSNSQLTQTEYVLTEFYCYRNIVHQWRKTLDNRLIYRRWVDGEIRTIDGQTYQCRQDRIVCENDLDLEKEVSFQTYVDQSGVSGLMLFRLAFTGKCVY